MFQVKSPLAGLLTAGIIPLVVFFALQHFKAFILRTAKYLLVTKTKTKNYNFK